MKKIIDQIEGNDKTSVAPGNLKIHKKELKMHIFILLSMQFVNLYIFFIRISMLVYLSRGVYYSYSAYSFLDRIYSTLNFARCSQHIVWCS